ADSGAYRMQMAVHLRIIRALVGGKVKPRGGTSRQEDDYGDKQGRPAVALQKSDKLRRLLPGSRGLGFALRLHFKLGPKFAGLHACNCLASMFGPASVVRYRLRLRLL